MAGRGEEQGVAVGRSLGHEIRADHAARARLVLHHHGLAEQWREGLTDHARHRVGAAPGRETDDQADGAIRIGLRTRRAANEKDEKEKKSHPSAMLFSSTPTLSISISTLSPGFIPIGGVRRAPTPPGVPVTSTSPGTSVVQVETYSMIFGILKIICSVVACCMRSPFSRQESVILVFGGISSAVTIHGPKPPVRAKFLPAVHWMVWRCQSRTEPSL